jgi:hypothetical protein
MAKKMLDHLTRTMGVQALLIVGFPLGEEDEPAISK